MSHSDSLPLRKRGPYSYVSDEIRARIIRAYENGADRDQLINSFSIKRQTLGNILNIFEREKRVERRPKGGSKPKLSAEERMKIKEWLDEDCCLRLKDIQVMIFETFEKQVSLATIDRSIKSFHYTFKRTAQIPQRRNDPEVIEQRVQYALKFNRMALTKEKMFFLDEFGIQVWSRRSYGRSLVGTRANKKVKYLRSRNYTVYAAMSNQSLFFFEVSSTSYKATNFSEYLEKLFSYLTTNNIQNAFIIMDNARINKPDGVIASIEKAGH